MGYQIISCESDNIYRYSLTVKTDCNSDKKLAIIQCNPSIANANNSDPTVGKVSYWAEANQFTEITFLNLFAYISPKISGLSDKEYSFLVGPNNNEALHKYLSNGLTVVLAWGGNVPVGKAIYSKRLKEIKTILSNAQIRPYKVGALSYGTHPRHGRMWNRGNRQLSPVEWSEIIV